MISRVQTFQNNAQYCNIYSLEVISRVQTFQIPTQSCNVCRLKVISNATLAMAQVNVLQRLAKNREMDPLLSPQSQGPIAHPG